MTLMITDDYQTSAESSFFANSHRTGFKCRENGYFRDPYDCEKFYFCSESERIDYQCPRRKAFHHVLKRCIAARLIRNCKIKMYS